MLDSLPTARLRGVSFHSITEEHCIRCIGDGLDRGLGGWVITANLDHLRRALVDPVYRRFCEEATLVVADGMPLVWASRIQGTPLPERVAGSSLISSLSQEAAIWGRSLYMLGGVPGTAEMAGEVLKRRHSSLKIAGSHCPDFGFENNPDQVQHIIDLLVEAQPDIVYVALGSPKQEHLIERLREVLPNAWWMGVGIGFSFLCGDVRRAPRWMQVAGLEWLHRLAQEPQRLAGRYIADGIPFALSLLATSLGARMRGRQKEPGDLA
ncbi:MAG: WecB/TagA/CpsF family glycosyltransferase [bacterium]|nr:WecB/TagA/CpsF family glycosyltransferase [bacterium]